MNTLKNKSAAKTAGYDLLILLNKKFLNEVSGALFYNNFLTFNGKKSFAVGKDALPSTTLAKIPDNLKSFLDIRYRCKLLHEPHIQFTTDQKIQVGAHLRLYIWMMDGLEIKFDASLNLIAPLKIDFTNKKPEIDFKSSTIKQFDIKYNYSDSENITLHLSKLFQTAISAYLDDNSNPVAIELPLIEPYLPYTNQVEKNKIPIHVREIKIVDAETMVVAINLFNSTAGNPLGITNFARNCNLGLAISEEAMLKVYNFFWDNTSWDKTYYKSDGFRIPMVDKVLGIVTEVIGFIGKVATKVITAGFIDLKIDYISTDFNYTLSLDFIRKPTFDLMSGNRVAIRNLGLRISIQLKVVLTYKELVYFDTSGFIPDKCTPWEDDIKISEKRRQKTILNIGVVIPELLLRYGIGELYINEERKTLEVRILDFDVNLLDFIDNSCGFLHIPESLRIKIKNSIKQKIIESIPPMVLSPSIKDVKIPGVNWPLTIEGRKLTVTDDEVIIGAFLSFKEIQNNIAPVPKYIGNYNNMEVHRIGCDSILDTYETHQRGFFTLQQALNKGYDGCKKCLPAYHKK